MLSEDSQTTLKDSYSGTLNPSLGAVIVTFGGYYQLLQKVRCVCT